VTIPRTSTPPEIDGALDDPAWRTAVLIDRFVQERPVEGAPATERTEVRLAYDSANLYVGIHAYYADPGTVRANRTDRDQTDEDDTVSVFFDPFLDQQRAYLFSVNGYGVQRDALVQSRGGGGGGGCCGGGGGGGGRDGDPSWNALYDSAGRLVEDGWTAEMRIPFKSVRYPTRAPGESHRWGFQIQRAIQGKNEHVVWAPVSSNILGRLGQIGSLDGLTNLSTSRNLEFLPTFTAANVGALDAPAGRFERLDAQPEAGLDIRYGLTSNITANFTVNPEFSQIESDNPQIAVNRRFPLFFPEQRPFFLDGAEIFAIEGPVTLVHTRTIVDPRYGAKLSGTVGRTTFGILAASDEAPGHTDDPADPAFDQSASFFIGRARYDLYEESHVGVLFTDREFLDGHSRVAGLDATLRLGQSHQFGFRAVGTQHRDETGARRGSLWDASIRKEGRHLSYFVAHYEIDPGYRNDAGFARRVDVKRTMSSIEYDWRPEGRVVRWGPEFSYARNTNFAGELLDEEFDVDVNVQFANNMDVRACVRREMERFEGVDFWKWGWCIEGEVNASRLIAVSAELEGGDEIRFVTNPFLGRGRGLGLNVTLRPFSRLESRLNLNTSRLRDPRSGERIFDVKILRARTTYQFTNRLLLRNVTEFNTFDKTVGLNLLLTYRVNAGTAFFLGYDDHYQRGDLIEDLLDPTERYERTNRAIFTKIQYLFRY
jgi:hypothetical protein